MTGSLITTGRIFSIVSVLILGVGFVIFAKRRVHAISGYYVLFLLALELISFCAGFFIGKYNLFLFWVSTIVNFFFLSSLYLPILFQQKKKLTRYFIAIGLVAIALLILLGKMDLLPMYLRLGFGFLFVIYGLITVYTSLKTESEVSASLLTLTFFLLLFFSIDTFLASCTVFMVRFELEIVAGFWFVRALFLQLFYIGLLNYSWRIKGSH